MKSLAVVLLLGGLTHASDKFSISGTIARQEQKLADAEEALYQIDKEKYKKEMV
jgi:hypothetical protein